MQSAVTLTLSQSNPLSSGLYAGEGFLLPSWSRAGTLENVLGLRSIKARRSELIDTMSLANRLLYSLNSFSSDVTKPKSISNLSRIPKE